MTSLATTFPTDYVSLDLETTGFSPSYAKITEIGAVRVRDGKVVDQFQSLVNPQTHIPSKVQELTGITDVMVENLDPIEDVFPQFIDWMNADASDIPVLGHNVRKFDFNFLNAASADILGTAFNYTSYDTMQISRELFPHEHGHKLVDLIQRFDIADIEEHRALSDAVQTHQCFEWMKQYLDSHNRQYAFREMHDDNGTHRVIALR